MSKLNEIFKFDKNSLVHLDVKTKGYKTLSKMLDKKGVRWTNDKDPNATHIVCTRLACNSLRPNEEIILNPLWDKLASDTDKKRFKDVSDRHVNVYHIFNNSTNINRSCKIKYNIKPNGGMLVVSNNIPKFIESKAWDIYRSKRIYSFKNFKNILENENRTEINEDDKSKIIDLLKSGDNANVKLSLILIEKYSLDKEWIPWLKLNSNILEVRKFLKANNINYTNNYWNNNYGLKDKIKAIKNTLHGTINNLAGSDINKNELIKDILNL